MTGDEKHEWAAASTIDVLWVLYDQVLNVTPATVDDPDRDRFLLSKGHGPMAYYAVLAEKGFIEESILDSWTSWDSPLGQHPDRILVPGVEISSGSLGHGLAIAVGPPQGPRGGQRRRRPVGGGGGQRALLRILLRGLVRLRGDDLNLDVAAVWCQVRQLVAHLGAVHGNADRGLLGVDLEVGVAGNFAGAEQEGGFVACDIGDYQHARLDNSVIGRSFAYVGATQQILQVQDAGFGLALLFTSGVVTAVLLQVTFRTCLLDTGNDLGTSRA